MHVVSQPDAIADQQRVNLWQVTMEVARHSQQEVPQVQQDVPTKNSRTSGNGYKQAIADAQTNMPSGTPRMTRRLRR